MLLSWCRFLLATCFVITWIPAPLLTVFSFHRAEHSILTHHLSSTNQSRIYLPFTPPTVTLSLTLLMPIDLYGQDRDTNKLCVYYTKKKPSWWLHRIASVVTKLVTPHLLSGATGPSSVPIQRGCVVWTTGAGWPSAHPLCRFNVGCLNVSTFRE